MDTTQYLEMVKGFNQIIIGIQETNEKLEKLIKIVGEEETETEKTEEMEEQTNG